jgi:type II secretory ATPase GspE/PulE/Tfp pilus assembly ATPase PilB-like protein
MDHPFLSVAELANYINGFKFLPVVVISLVWLRLMTWADKDAPKSHLPREVINMINLGGLVVAVGQMLLIPNYWAALAVFLFIFLSEIGYYLIWRNQTVGLKDLSDEIKDFFSSFGRRKPKEIKASHDTTVLVDKSGKPMPPPAEEDPFRPAYDGLQSFLQQPVKLNAQRIELRPMDGAMVQCYTVDGIVFEGQTFTKELASEMIAMIKSLAGMDKNDRRKPQTGKMTIKTDQSRHEVDVYTAGSTAGELMRFSIDSKKQLDFTVDTLGLLPDQLESLTNVIADPSGVVLLCAPKGQGLTNLCYAVLKKHDAFLTHIQTLERDPQSDLEGIRHNILPASASVNEELKQIDWLISQEPDVIYIDWIEDPRTAVSLAKFALTGKRVYVAMRSPTAFDALTRWRKLIGDDSLATDSLKLIVAERLVRLLCKACKVAYLPDPEALKKMNMSPERVDKLYQARKEPLRDQKGNEVICPFCQGLGYKGRTGVFELFSIDDEVRKVIVEGGTINQLKALFRKQRQRYLQESALARVELGDTSVEEVLRVLRGPSTGGETSSATRPVSSTSPQV